MDATSLMLSLLFGCIGFGMFTFGRKTSRFVPMIAGGALCIVPYFITDITLLLIVCCVLMASPWFFRET